QGQKLPNQYNKENVIENEKLNLLLQRWKADLNKQSQDFNNILQDVDKSMQEIENSFIYYESISQISNDVSQQFSTAQTEIYNIQQFQVQIDQNLDSLRKFLVDLLLKQGDNIQNVFDNPICEKIQNIDCGLQEIELNINQIISELNPINQRNQKNDKKIIDSLNSYYSILEKLESDSNNLRHKMNSIMQNSYNYSNNIF
ncbi:hypothetical protein IMG5_025400, partial [Ichthyophthirius multifiliis]